MPPSSESEVPHVLLPGAGGIDVSGWSIRAHRGPIATSSKEESLSSELGIKMPGMLFDSNGLSLVHNASGLSLSFQTVAALRGVGPADPSIRVAAAKVWDKREAPEDVEIGVLEGASDWTFSTKYAGDVEGVEGGSAGFSEQNAEGVDYDSLKRTDVPILYYADVLLFEDELDDNGTASYRVRLRVMPDCLFVLARFFLRVDGVLVRVYDTRYFYRFGGGVLVRERVTREADHGELRKTIPSEIIRDPDQLSTRMPVINSIVENLSIPAAAGIDKFSTIESRVT